MERVTNKAEVWRCDLNPDHWWAPGDVFRMDDDPKAYCNLGECPGECQPWIATPDPNYVVPN